MDMSSSPAQCSAPCYKSERILPWLCLWTILHGVMEGWNGNYILVWSVVTGMGSLLCHSHHRCSQLCSSSEYLILLSSFFIFSSLLSSDQMQLWACISRITVSDWSKLRVYFRHYNTCISACVCNWRLHILERFTHPLAYCMEHGLLLLFCDTLATSFLK